MANISGNTVGVDFTDVYTAAEAASGIKPRPFKTGQTVFGDDGKTYQYVKANATIGASNTAANITVSNGEYVAAASGGSADNASGVELSSGDYAWFIID
ncbi:hypothetical protein ROJ8625_04096 [Roseivivax jejudonensis]|uniref:Uncharacterized protein n=1 Tax=Roseivivax jejudonensis TaxID=1529041 RepID=A0A1X7ABG1_9RHOB|nr:hypothetical protein [Roseivivax jejudonensis]SLN74759.1 hypothetical protein ROJ8625_04096 [Roseivivax jejudonensis]